MLDDLRNSSSFIDEEDNQKTAEAQNTTLRTEYHQEKSSFLGMTAQQRFILSLILFIMVFILGVFALVVSGSIVLPY
jgi:hypothetical protein